VVSQIVIKRDGRCVICGSTEKLGNGHLFTRTAYSTRWDLVNSNCQCWSHNYLHEYDPAPYTTWFIKKYGMNAYETLHLKFATTHKYSDAQLVELLEELQKVLKQYE